MQPYWILSELVPYIRIEWFSWKIETKGREKIGPEPIQFVWGTFRHLDRVKCLSVRCKTNNLLHQLFLLRNVSRTIWNLLKLWSVNVRDKWSTYIAISLAVLELLQTDDFWITNDLFRIDIMLILRFSIFVEKKTPRKMIIEMLSFSSNVNIFAFVM